MTWTTELRRIDAALDAADEALRPFTPGAIDSVLKQGGDPLTEADHAVNDAILAVLPGPGEGWLSEETADDATRLECRRVWVVDPIDGTREFIQGIPEWCVSVGLVENGRAVAGGILSPATGRRILGSRETGVTLNGRPVETRKPSGLAGALVLASRSEVKRGEWDRFFSSPISVRNMGSVAYKLGLVGAGEADATWTLVPKHEWDVVGGAAIVTAAGGQVFTLDGEEPEFNQHSPKMAGFVAAAPGLERAVLEFLEIA